MFCIISGKKYAVLHAVDGATSYSEAVISSSRSTDSIAAALEVIWILRHGALSSFASDEEFQTRPMQIFLSYHYISLCERPVRRHNKSGVVERKNGTVKRILERLQHDNSTASDATLLARATLLSNVFSGSKLLSSFELAIGYAPAILSLPQSVVSSELLEAYRDQCATRALQRLLSSRVSSTVPPSALREGRKILNFYKSSKQNEAIEWKQGEVVSAHDNFVRIRTSAGRLFTIAYEDRSLRLSSQLTLHLMDGIVEDVIAQPEVGDMGQILPDSASSPSSSHSPSTPLDTRQYALLREATLIRDDPPPAPTNHAVRDIGSHADATHALKDVIGSSLQTDKQAVLKERSSSLLDQKQVNGSRLSFAIKWILREAFDVEMRDNWASAFEIVDQEALPPSVNLIGCHTFYKVKDYGGILRLKFRNVLHENRDRALYEVRRDSFSADLSVVRLIIFLGIILCFPFGTADVKGAYMQSGPIKREIYVRRPK